MAAKSRVLLKITKRAALLLSLAAFICTGAPLAAQQAAIESLHGDVRLVLPPVVYAVPGVETNIYFDNVILTPNVADYTFEVQCEKGGSFADRWQYTPQADDSGSYPLTLEVRDAKNSLVARAHSVVKVVPANAGAGRAVTLLAVGDSLTQAAIYTQRLLDLSSGPKGPELTLIGSRGRGNAPAHGPNRFEGYGGWTARAFATFTGPLSRSGQFRPGETGSPFVFGGNPPRLDFARYCDQFNAGKAPDFVTIALGTNDIFLATDGDIDSVIDSVFGYFDSLIAMIHHFDRNTRIGMLLVIPPSATQDGFQHYRGRLRQTRWQYRRNQHRMIERMIAKYGGREGENIDLVPTYLGLDAAHNFRTRPLQWNADNPEQVPRVVDGIHPSDAGYDQMGDAIFAWMKSRLSGSTAVVPPHPSTR